MRKESCRTCGIQMEPELKCEVCRDFIALHCSNCGRTNDPQIHTHQK